MQTSVAPPVASADRKVDSTIFEERELGRGRSGVVYHSRDEAGLDIARKVFGSGGLPKIAQYLFLGAPNPYAWCEAAIRTAVLRRRVVAELVEFWFAGRLRVARASGHRWNRESRSFEMHCELVSGRHVALRHPYATRCDDELRDLTRRVMKPLQAHLAEAGLDGLVWQAGRGNPVALNNFMCESADGDRVFRWAWIDLESGVPALIPANPLDLLLFYLPKSFRHRRPLFDDFDVEKLKAYVVRRRSELEGKLGIERVVRLREDIDGMSESQREWKSLAWHRCSIAYRLATGAIGDEQAEFYGRHPLRWYGREGVRAARSAPAILAALCSQFMGLLARINVGHALRACWGALRSQTYRDRLARGYVAGRITKWQDRGQIKDEHARTLRTYLDAEESAAYLADFGVHLAVKPIIKFVQFCVMPALWMAGAIDGAVLGAMWLGAGSVVRTLYTLGRVAQNAFGGREKPWTALWVGTVPVLGNLAFPTQIVFSGAGEDHIIGRFILYDTFSRLGRYVPIWGGEDTLTEHLANRIPSLLPRSRSQGPKEDAGVDAVNSVATSAVAETSVGLR